MNEAAIYATLVAFVKEYTGIEYVYQGWQNSASLPAESEEYAVVSLLSSTLIHTPVERFNEDGEYEISCQNELLAQIDVCGNDDGARSRAQKLRLAASSSVGINFFRERSLSVLYAEEVKDISSTGDTNQFVRRYTLTLHLSAWDVLTVDQDWFNKARPHIENVEVHHPDL